MAQAVLEGQAVWQIQRKGTTCSVHLEYLLLDILLLGYNLLAIGKNR